MLLQQSARDTKALSLGAVGSCQLWRGLSCCSWPVAATFAGSVLASEEITGARLQAVCASEEVSWVEAQLQAAEK